MRFKIFLLIAIIFILGILIVIVGNRDHLAQGMWQKYHNADYALILDKSDAGLAMQIGSYYFNGTIGGGDYNPDIARKAYGKAISIDPKILWGHYQLARIYFVKADFSSALNEINKELEYNPGNLRSLYVRGLIYGYSGSLSDAENDFRRFTEWAPKEWAGYNDLAWILEKEGKYANAKKAIQSAMQNIPDADKNPWLWNSLGVAELNVKDYQSAKSSFETAKNLADTLTTTDWASSYPGNDPASAASGLAAFKSAIEANIAKVGTVYN